MTGYGRPLNVHYMCGLGEMGFSSTRYRFDTVECPKIEFTVNLYYVKGKKKSQGLEVTPSLLDGYVRQPMTSV